MESSAGTHTVTVTVRMAKLDDIQFTFQPDSADDHEKVCDRDKGSSKLEVDLRLSTTTSTRCAEINKLPFHSPAVLVSTAMQQQTMANGYGSLR